MPKNQEKQPYHATISQMRVLASPLRIEIVGVFQSYGSLAIRELAEKMSRPMDGLYHHVRQLLKVGIFCALPKDGAWASAMSQFMS